MQTEIRLAETEDEVRACFPVVRELRTHLDLEEYLRRVAVQREEHFALAYAAGPDGVCAVAGFRILHNLFTGRVLYVDDLVTSAAHRSEGHGAALMGWLAEYARARGCDSLELDSGVQRFDAHRFYLVQRLEISAHHFRRVLE